jgi:hypothetical protein
MKDKKGGHFKKGKEMSLASILSAGAAAYSNDNASKLSKLTNDNRPAKNLISQAELKNTAKMRAQAQEALRDDRQIDLI